MLIFNLDTHVKKIVIVFVYHVVFENRINKSDLFQFVVALQMSNCTLASFQKECLQSIHEISYLLTILDKFLNNNIQYSMLVDVANMLDDFLIIIKLSIG